MSVIPLTVFFSLLLAGTFVVLFAREQRRRHLTSPERDSLLPLADERPVVERDLRARSERVRRPRSTLEHAHDQPGQVHAAGKCGCRSGVRTPCAGCLRQRDEQEPAYF